MAYSMNPYLPRLRARAVLMVSQGQSIRQVSKYFGVQPSTVSRWCKKAPLIGTHVIATESSRPKSHPKQLDEKIVEKIVAKRLEHGRCADIIHQELLQENISVSLSSVKRTLDRKRLTKKKSPWKRIHVSPKRPKVAFPGDLVQIDTIHMMQSEKKRIYIYTMLDLYSRWAYAWASEKMSAGKTINFVNSAKEKFPFEFNCLQSDNGPEFSQHFSERISVKHRHSRVRRPNDNAHLERFNRTIQEEFLDKLPRDVDLINEYLPGYLKYYNEQRLHMGINFKTPAQMLS
jgi:transposase InsO family protein